MLAPDDPALSPAEQQFIRANLLTDVTALLLQPNRFAGLDPKKMAAQLVARQKIRDKLPDWYAHDGLVMPPPLSAEQASSAVTAQHKASLVSGAVLLDLTGGLGADTAAFARRMTQVVYAEQNPMLAQLAAHNLPALGHPNVRVRAENGLAVLQTWPGPAPDWVYLDPARRSETGGKLVRLADCDPDLTSADWQTALRTARHVLLKTSPLLDIDGAIRQLPGVTAVQIVAVQNEVKEILFTIDNQLFTEPTADPAGERIRRTAVNLLTTDTPFCFTPADERAAAVRLGDPAAFVYEPNAALLKAGAFRILGERFGLVKLAPHSHLYTADRLVADFPGRIFALETALKPDRKLLQAHLPAMKANLTTRNFPQATDNLRQQLGLRDGGDVYILATTLTNGAKRLLLCRKVNAHS